MLHHHKRILILGICTMIVIIVLVAVIGSYPEPPLHKIDLSRIALNQASKANAVYYAPYAFDEAKKSWHKTLEIWRQENRKIFFKRSYEPLDQLAERTITLAQQSEKQAMQAYDSLRSLARFELILLLERINEFKTKYDRMPINETVRKKMVDGELLVLEGQAALRRQDIRKAIKKFNEAEKLIGQSGKEVTDMLNEYLTNIPIWQQWAREAINGSKENNDIAIIIDKFDHFLFIYDKGQLAQKYTIELGKNWIGHKRQQGDNATPEGQYTITKKIQSGQSKYYKALVINYPNETDVENFTAAKKRGDLPKDARIGGSIEIHGEGGKGINWTQGCIALKNEDLDQIFNIIKIGTPVTIVGSLNNTIHDNYSPGSN